MESRALAGLFSPLTETRRVPGTWPGRGPPRAGPAQGRVVREADLGGMRGKERLGCPRWNMEGEYPEIVSGASSRGWGQV